MKEDDPTNNSQESWEVPLLKNGTNAIYVPELREINFLGEVRVLPPEEVLPKLQSFLDALAQQGGEILGVLPVQVNMGFESDVIVEKHVLLVKKD